MEFANADESVMGGASRRPAALRYRDDLPRLVDERVPSLAAVICGLNEREAKFTELAAGFAAAIRDIPKEDLLSQEVRQQRRALTLAWSWAAPLRPLLP